MVMHTIPLQNISCEACEKVITRTLSRFPGVKIASFAKDGKHITVECPEGGMEEIKRVLRERHYLNEDSPPIPHVWFILKNVLRGTNGFAAEHALVTRAFLLMATLFAALTLAARGWWGGDAGFQTLFPLFALFPVGLSISTAALLHVRELRHHFTCSNGMMAGMIVGMMMGFMSGALFGATNGMFVGSLMGMGIGMFFSAWIVRKAGVMSILEGLMAGLMAGTMGAMLSVMMLTDHLVLFLYVLFGICLLILGGMSYFLVKEIGPVDAEYRETPLFPLAVLNMLLLLGLMTIALYGPKSTIAWGVIG